jgi:hypothetical protein
MPNPVLDRLRVQRAEQVHFVEEMLTRIDADNRDMVDAERANLTSTRERIAELDEQISPLEEFETMRSAHEASMSRMGPPRGDARPVGDAAAPEYRSAGAFVVDSLCARGMPRRDGPGQLPPDADAAGRIARVVAPMKTTDTPGLLPTPIIGPVVNLIDASRPFITSLGGGKPMGSIAGSQFERPKIIQHTMSGLQGGEKTELPSQALKVAALLFSKSTHGGTVNISRQDIDWTSPAAWDILIQDLADIYGIDVETTVVAEFVASITTNSTPVATDDLAGWAHALYLAAAQCYAGAKRLPDRVWCSIDMWAAMGSVVDIARLAMPPGTDGPSSIQPGALGEADLRDFGGYVLQLPRIVVPTMPAGTIVVGSSTLFEVYEETIGLLSVVEPSILGVQVAYGGYIAAGMLEEKGFAKLTAPAGARVASGGKR